MTGQFSRTFLQIHELSSPWFSLLPFQVFSRISRTCYEPWLKKNSKFGKQGVAVSQVWELLTRYNSSLQSFRSNMKSLQLIEAKISFTGKSKNSKSWQTGSSWAHIWKSLTRYNSSLSSFRPNMTSFHNKEAEKCL